MAAAASRRAGPLGTHFSSQRLPAVDRLRNKLIDHESRQYTYIFEHSDDYCDDITLRQERIDRINEMERWLNQKIKALASERCNVELLNEYRAKWPLSARKEAAHSRFRDDASETKIEDLVAAVRALLG